MKAIRAPSPSTMTEIEKRACRKTASVSTCASGNLGPVLRYSLPPPALCERRHSRLATLGIAVRWRADPGYFTEGSIRAGQSRSGRWASTIASHSGFSRQWPWTNPISRQARPTALFLCSEAGVGLPPRRKYSRSSVVMTSAEPLATQVQYTTMFSRGNPAFSAAARCVLKQS